MVNEVMKFVTSYDKEVGEALELECAPEKELRADRVGKHRF